MIILCVPVVLGAAIGGFARGQTSRTGPLAYPTSRTMRSADATSALNPCYSGTNPTSPGYTGTPDFFYSAITPLEVAAPKTKIRQPSVHSFTADQAKSRIEASGYSIVSGLQKDKKGVWRGKAMKNGKIVDVILYFEGKVDAK